MAHALMAKPNHDERAEQYFVRDFKIFLNQAVDPQTRKLAEASERALGRPATEPADVVEVYQDLMEHELFRAWVSTRRSVQEMMWNVVGESVDRQIGALKAKAAGAAAKGSVTLDPGFVVPSYIANQDIHLMPGGYGVDEGEGDLRQGAIMDRGGAVYMLGRNGGMLNDGRGQTAAAHLINLYPDIKPKRILELGCGVGVSTVAMAQQFPDAEVYGVDVGGAMLRYAHARAQGLDTAVHFSQQNAEATDFEDGSFDLIFTCALFHETAMAAMPKIFKEMHRLLAPGGVAVNLEVPARYERMTIWDKIIGEFETHYNNEPFWRGAIVADYQGLMTAAGFQTVTLGYQPAAADGRRDAKGFAAEPGGGGFSWFVASARKS